MNMPDIEEIWNRAEWLEQARWLISGFDNSPFVSSTGMILRHSKRNEPSLWDEDQNMELTEVGKKIARLFGTKIPISKNLIIFHSGVNRCRETAELIAEGFSEIGGKALMKGECLILRGIGLNQNLFIEELKKYPLVEVIMRWIAGLYPEEQWPSFKNYCQRTANLLWPFIEKQKQNTLSIFITHDIHSIILIYDWFGFPLDLRGINYLGGFAFTLWDNMIQVLDYGELKTTEIPYYWNR
jgi:broad specificity phosphatase PhoE